MAEINPIIDESWKTVLADEFRSEYFNEIKQKLLAEKEKFIVYPPGSQIFSAFNKTPFDKVRVVIIGQDPYHGQGQANGMCFSVSQGVKKPPSLVNIFQEIKNDLGYPEPYSGDLTKWAEQGVLLLNASLTVRANSPNSHQDIGWQKFTDKVIDLLSKNKNHLVFILWGKFAQTKEILIDSTRHFILKAAHPSPFSAYSGFFGCKHFSKTNEILKSKGYPEIDWYINDTLFQ